MCEGRCPKVVVEGVDLEAHHHNKQVVSKHSPVETSMLSAQKCICWLMRCVPAMKNRPESSDEEVLVVTESVRMKIP